MITSIRGSKALQEHQGDDITEGRCCGVTGVVDPEGSFLVMMCHSVETASLNVKSGAMDDSDGLRLLPQNPVASYVRKPGLHRSSYTTTTKGDFDNKVD